MDDITLYRILIVVLFAFAAVTFFSLLVIPAPYGRHVRMGWGHTVRAKLGWLIMELPAFLDLTLITERASVTSQQAATATNQLLDKEGIFAGLSSGAVVHQAIKVANEMDEGKIVVVLADGGWKYLSLDFWNKAK